MIMRFSVNPHDKGVRGPIASERVCL